MSFAHPLALLLGLLVVPVVLLYRRKASAPQHTVATSAFWQRALAEERFRWAWQRWRERVSLALQLMIVVLLTLAAAGPLIPPPQRIVVVLDNSAGMRATDVEPTRLDEAKAAARRLIEGLRECDALGLVTTGGTPAEALPLTKDRAAMLAAIDAVKAVDAPSEIEWAMRMVYQLPDSAGSPLRVTLITDACAKEAVKRAMDDGAEVLRVGTAAGNVAITRFAARRVPADPRKCETLVELRNLADQPAECRLTVSVDGRAEAPVEVSLAKNGLWRQVFEYNVPGTARLTTHVQAAEPYPLDNAASLQLPSVPTHRVRLVCEGESCLKPLLSADPRVKLVAEDAPAAKTICVYEGSLPLQLPPGPALVFNPSDCDLWKLGDAVADPAIAGSEEKSSIAGGLRLTDAYLAEAKRLQPAATVQGVVRPLFWAADGAPLALAIDRPEGRVVVVAGSLAMGNLPLQANFPTLLDRSLDWLSGQPTWSDEVVACAERSAGAMGELSALDLRVPGDLGVDAKTFDPPQPWPPLALVPAALAGVLLVIEWCLYQRRWIS